MSPHKQGDNAPDLYLMAGERPKRKADGKPNTQRSESRHPIPDGGPRKINTSPETLGSFHVSPEEAAEAERDAPF